jgi:hypothetical protein
MSFYIKLYKQFVFTVVYFFHVKWVPCYHSMACPQVVDGRNGLQIWRVAANVLNKQLQTAYKEWSSSLGVGYEANSSSPYKKKACHEMLHRALDLGRFFEKI